MNDPFVHLSPLPSSVVRVLNQVGDSVFGSRLLFVVTRAVASSPVRIGAGGRGAPVG